MHQCCSNGSDGEREGRERGKKERKEGKGRGRGRKREKGVKRGREGKISRHADKRQFQFGPDLVRSQC